MIYQILRRTINVCVLLLKREASKAAAEAAKLQAAQRRVAMETEAAIARLESRNKLAQYELGEELTQARQLMHKSNNLARKLENLDA